MADEPVQSEQRPSEPSDAELRDLDLSNEAAAQVKGGEAVLTESISLNRK